MEEWNIIKIEVIDSAIFNHISAGRKGRRLRCQGNPPADVRAYGVVYHGATISTVYQYAVIAFCYLVA